MKHVTHVEIETKVMTIEAREVREGDLLLKVDQNFKIAPWFVKFATLVFPEHVDYRMMELTITDNEGETMQERFRDTEKVTVVRVR